MSKFISFENESVSARGVARLGMRSFAVAIGACVLSMALSGVCDVAQAAAATPVEGANIAREINLARPATAPGQSATLMPDGRWLLLGGAGTANHVQASGQLLDLRTGKATPLAASLSVPRAGHTATVLPDGSVLILGGTNDAGSPLAVAERFHPDTQRFEALGNLSLIPRSQHTATLLMDGRVLIAGGLDARGHALDQVELLDAGSMSVESFNARLETARFAHLGALLPSGDVFVWGGLGDDHKPIANGELFDEGLGRFAGLGELPNLADLVPPQSYLDTVPGVQATLPASGAGNVALTAPIVVRFTKPLRPETLNAQSVTLVGPGGPVNVNVVAAEAGLLVFATPTQALLPGSRYTVFVNGALDESNRAVPFTAVGFTTQALGGSGKAGGALVAPTASVVARSVAPPIPAASEPQPLAAALDDEDWIPGPQNYHGDWESHRHSLAQATPPHRLSVAIRLHGKKFAETHGASLPDAPPGVTAVAGQMLRLNGKPLVGATLSVAGVSTTTDANGEFLLASIPSGTQTLVMDGSTADQGTRHYGRFEYLLHAIAGKTTALPFVIWMTKLDVAQDVKITSPTAAPTVLTNPKIPGLELHLPAGMVIRDANGNVVTQLDMTAIPTDQAPFPLPNVPVPTYFTIQPGGAHLLGLTPDAAKGAQLIYPNFTASRPGTRIDFWNYDPRGKGWYVYGQGTVSVDGAQIMPDPGVVIYEFTGAMVAVPVTAPPTWPPCDCKAALVPDPVDLFSGLFLDENTDLMVPDVLPLEVRRVYRPNDEASRAFGIGANLGYDIFLIGDTNPWTYADLVMPDGSRVQFTNTDTSGSFESANYVSQTGQGAFFGATMKYGNFVTGGDGWTIMLRDGTRYAFPDSYQSASARAAALNGISDRVGNTLTITRDVNFNLIQVTSVNQRSIVFTYDSSNRITDAIDDIGRHAHYDYDSSGRLAAATDIAGAAEIYTYDDQDRMLTVMDRRGNRRVLNEYDAYGSVHRQTYADNTTRQFDYTRDVNNLVQQVDVTDPRGYVQRTTFNQMGVPVTEIRALGTPLQETTVYSVDPITSLLSQVTDAHGRTVNLSYDAVGNLQQTTFMQSEKNAESWNWNYDPNTHLLQSTTDPLSRGYTVTPDTYGNPAVITDLLQHSVNLSYDSQGRPSSVTLHPDPSHALTSTIGFAKADLVNVTDPLSHAVVAQYDDGGLLSNVSRPLGQSNTFKRDAFGRATQVTNALNQSTGGKFDPNGNLTDFSDGDQNPTHFDYDTLNRVSAKTDGLGRVESYTYDAEGRLATILDREKQVTGFTYDALGRLQQVGYGGTTVPPTSFLSTINYAYTWTGTQLQVTITDSYAGVYTRTYDEFSRLKEESGPQGTIDYTYYGNGLRSTMTVAGQPAVTYTWDLANRLTQIQQAAGPLNNSVAQTVKLGYDGANRRTSTTLANGMQMVYGYDDASQLKSITYLNPDNSTYGDLSYGYDTAGHRISKGGSLATQDLPSGSVSGATYDANNRLSNTWLGASYSYDNNGNVTSDGTYIYGWNERNQLVTVTQGSTTVATFQYDPLGRRIAKTLKGATTGYLYDGGNVVQELSATGSPSANLLNGLSLDERFLRIVGSGSSAVEASFLTDAQGSTIALTLPDGSTQETYSYQAYGATTSTGQSDNPYQYTGRENDASVGLYYYRTRYFSPILGRFLSEDRIGLLGGQNVYGYGYGNPIGNADPTGQCPPCLIALAVEAVELVEAAEAAEAAVAIAEEAAEAEEAVSVISEAAEVEAESIEAAEAEEAETEAETNQETIDRLNKQAEQRYPKKAGKCENHHIWPKYLNGDPKGPLARIPAAYHQLITNEFFQYAPAGSGSSITIQEVLGILQQVYSKLPLP